MLSLPFIYPDGALLPKLDDAVRRLQRAIQAPIEMIAASAISAVALACQRGYLVERKPGLVFPIGLAFITMALPSERKSSTDRRFLRAIRDYQDMMEGQTNARLKDWCASQIILNAKKTGISRAITKLISHGEDTSILEQQLETLLKTTSNKPKHTRLIAEKASADAILNFFHNYGNSCGVMVDEGSVFFDSSAAKHAGMFAKLWSSDELRLDRTNEESFTIRSPRLTMSIMAPPEIAHDFLATKGKHWRASGLLSRFLVSYPQSTMGTRFENVYFPVNADLGVYDERIREILSSAPCSGTVESVTLKFEEPARQELANYANFLESHIGPLGYFSDISDAASKMAENAARMAAIFHIFEGYEGSICLDTLNRAKVICNWHLSEFKRLFGQHPQIPTVQEDAMEVEKCIQGFYNEVGYGVPCPKNRISQYTRGAVRKDPQRRSAALAYLRQNGRIEFYNIPGDKTTYVRNLCINAGNFVDSNGPLSGALVQPPAQNQFRPAINC